MSAQESTQMLANDEETCITRARVPASEVVHPLDVTTVGRPVALVALNSDAPPSPSQRSTEPGRRVLISPIGNRSRGYLAIKRTLDICGALVAIILFSPILITTYVVLFITTKGKPIFRQERVGFCGATFPMYKFRTMVLDSDKKQHVVKNEHATGPIFKNRRDPRITKIGRFLRSTSIDEMPQFFNVLMGHMSLVGPRPPIAKEVVQYQPWQLQRLAVKPGLTCLWQVSGRSEIGFEEWMRLDMRYVRKQSLETDVKLLAKTPLTVLSRRGAY